MLLSLQFNNSNDTCPFSHLWSKPVIDSQQSLFYVCVIATITHSIFGLQLVFCPSVRKKSIQWLYAYLITDILLLFRFFFAFIIHTTSNACIPNRAWSLFICYFEAVFDNYLNTLEVYILLALNICRHIQIAHNRNVYTTYVRSLICAHLAIYLAPLISFIIQFAVGWAQVKKYTNESCDVAYTNLYAAIFNIIITFALPISLNVFVIYASVRHVHLTSQLRRTQRHLSAREKYHRSLVVQFLFFYTVWLLLWSPNIITFQLKNGDNNIIMITQLLNYIEIALNPIIISALDARFQHAWCQIWEYLKKKCSIKPNRNQRQIGPNTISARLEIRRDIPETAV